MPVVSASPLVRTYTLDEFWALPEPMDRRKLELIAGVLYMSPPPDESHDYLVRTLVLVLSGHLAECRVGGGLYTPRAAIWTGERTYLEPDLFHLSAESEAKFRRSRRRTSADLAIEVLSSGSRLYDQNAKADTYFALGIRELWLVDESTRSVEIRQRIAEGITSRAYQQDEWIESSVFPLLRLRVGELFLN